MLEADRQKQSHGGREEGTEDRKKDRRRGREASWDTGEQREIVREPG